MGEPHSDARPGEAAQTDEKEEWWDSGGEAAPSARQLWPINFKGRCVTERGVSFPPAPCGWR